MEITTLITWNGLIYLIYYGVNIALDYYRSPGKQSMPTTSYTYKELLHEPAVKVEVSASAASTASPSRATAIRQEIAKIKQDSPVEITGPVEDQGIPFNEYMKNSKAFSSNIDF